MLLDAGPNFLLALLLLAPVTTAASDAGIWVWDELATAAGCPRLGRSLALGLLGIAARCPKLARALALGPLETA